MRKILLTILCAGIAAAFAACGSAREDERLTPPETLAGETFAPAESETGTEADAINAGLAASDEETTAAETTEAVTETVSETETAAESVPKTEAETDTPSGDDWIVGAWVCEDAYMPLVMVFKEDGKVDRLFRVPDDEIEDILVFENGEILYDGDEVLLTDLTVAEDTAEFRIYHAAERSGTPSDEAYYYVLDKNDLLYHMEIGENDFHYILTGDSLTVIDKAWSDGDTEYFSVECTDSDSFTITELAENGHTAHMYRAAHLDALANYLK